MKPRPPFIVSSGSLPEYSHVYPQSDEPMGPIRSPGSAGGLVRIGINLQRLPPGTRSSWPHAESDEEEFVYVIEGEVDAWIDGDIHRMVAGDLAAFPAGTGICHCFINNGEREALLLVGGEAPKPSNRIVYPVNPSRREDMKDGDWWHDAPRRPLGDHDGLPDSLRESKRAVRIADFPETRVACAEHRGPPALEYETSRQLIDWRIANGVTPAGHKTFGVHYTDPATTPPADHRVDFCVSFDGPVPPNPQGVVAKTIPANRCAVTRHLGDRSHNAAAVYLMREWLPRSGETPGDLPIFFHYVNVGPGVKEADMITDVYLPLRG